MDKKTVGSRSILLTGVEGCDIVAAQLYLAGGANSERSGFLLLPANETIS